ncbi:type IV toxin-antitoxin system AbiEi family antitoxin domain-containing protein [Specibacter cremeus]|uniref:type IV toxin-antitoxin system AbiEi family antitoxin domain-containing protein n=1 Tax=Specibacter cremeus TaxID=1629051 RepID=UPI000F782E36|nr:type IV toxin-antitoxin system AbiEi family antitoxin domain-containing protein [Specibacter cremeus]
MNTPQGRRPAGLDNAIARLGGAARRKDLLARGFSRWQIERAVGSGRIRHAGRGVYALPGSTALDVRLAENQARRTCLSKVADLGLWVLQEPRLIHVAAAHGRAIPGCVVHRVSGSMDLFDILRLCVRCSMDLEALVILESAVVKNVCSIGQLRETFAGRRDARARRILDMIDPQAMSPIETVGRYRIRAAGYNFQGQAKVRGVGHQDGLVEGVLGIEFDGEPYHNNAEAFAEDLRRGNAAVIAGVPTLHFSGKTVLYRPDVMLRDIAAALKTIRSAHR